MAMQLGMRNQWVEVLMRLAALGGPGRLCSGTGRACGGVAAGVTGIFCCR